MRCRGLPRTKRETTIQLWVVGWHYWWLRFSRIDRNQESVAVGIRKLVPCDIGSVRKRLVQLKSLVASGPKIVDVLQRYTFPISSLPAETPVTRIRFPFRFTPDKTSSVSKLPQMKLPQVCSSVSTSLFDVTVHGSRHALAVQRDGVR